MQRAGRLAVVRPCEASLRRLRTDRLDLYLLHWRGRVPLTETLRGFGRLLQTGRIRHWGVSNFHVADLAELVRLAGGAGVATDQALYSRVVEIAARHGATPAQVAIAWVLRHEHVIAIPQTGSPEHVRENRAAADLQLTAPDLADLNDAFPQPVSAGRPKVY